MCPNPQCIDACVITALRIIINSIPLYGYEHVIKFTAGVAIV